MKRYIKQPAHYMLLALFTLVLLSCQRNATSPSVLLTPSGNAISGKVVMHDEFRRPITDCSAAIVTITNGTSTYTDTAAVDGSWEIPDVPAGIYTISASAPGFAGGNFDDTDSLFAVQYVGSDVLHVSQLGLGKDLDPSFVSNGTASISWKYYYRGEDPTVITDSSAIVTVTFETMNTSWDSYRVTLTESPTADCADKIALTGGKPTVVGSTATLVDDYDLFYAARAKYGKTGFPLLYLQVRPTWSKKAPAGSAKPNTCLDPLVIPIQL